MEDKLDLYDEAIGELMGNLFILTDGIQKRSSSPAHLYLQNCMFYDEDMLIINICGMVNTFIPNSYEIEIKCGWLYYQKLKWYYTHKSMSHVFPLKRWKPHRLNDSERKFQVVNVATLLDSKVCSENNITWAEIWKEYYAKK